MRLEWVKQQLLRGAAAAAGASRTASHRPSGAGTAGKSSAYVIAESMEPAGCSCVVVTPQRRSGPQNEALRDDTALPEEQSARQKTSASPALHTRHRVTLPGITPGTILRTRATVAAWMRSARQLPAAEQYTVVMRDGCRMSGKLGSSVPLPALPCRHASAQTCVRCPWMALQVQQRTKAAKQKAWRASLQDAVRNCWAAAMQKARNSNGGRGAAVQHLSYKYEDVMNCFVFLEPLATPVQSNKLQALQLVFRQSVPQQQPLSSHDSVAVATSDVRSHEGELHEKNGEDVARIELVREGTALDDEGDTSAAVDCLLETLEQKRLVLYLQRWAAQLPASMQDRLHGVFISQPTATVNSPAAANESAPYSKNTSSLQVVLVVQHNPDALGLQSPLCGPAHPADLLSTEEQQLVGVVTAAAPVLADIEVVVCIRGDASQGEERAAAAFDVGVHVLYPTLNRAGCLRQLQCRRDDKWTASSADDGARKVTRSSEDAAALVVRCWCEPLEKELQARLAPYHAALSAVPELWLAVAEHHRGAAQLSSTRSSPRPNRSPALPWVQTFWRHPAALDTCCSVLMSLLLEEVEEGAGNVRGSAAAAVAPQLAKSTVKQSPWTVAVHALEGCGAAGPSPAEVGALAGQRILDAALRSFIRQTAAAAAVSSPAAAATCVADNTAKQCGVSSRTPQRMLISINDCGRQITIPADVEAVLTQPLVQPLRLCLYTCTSTMTTERLSECIASIAQTALSGGKAARVRTGVIDVDPLSSSYVAYAQVDLISQARQ